MGLRSPGADRDCIGRGHSRESAMRRVATAVGFVVAFTAGTWLAQAQAPERHPVLQRAIEQITNIKMRLQQAPRDFGGHKQKAIEALTVAASELQQGLEYDKK